VGYAAPKAPYPAKFRTDLVGTLSERRIRQQYQQWCHQPPNRFWPGSGLIQATGEAQLLTNGVFCQK
jgi:hypothetical protein